MVLSMLFLFVGNEVLNDVFDAVILKHCVFEYLSAVLATHTLNYAAHQSFELSTCAPKFILG